MGLKEGILGKRKGSRKMRVTVESGGQDQEQRHTCRDIGWKKADRGVCFECSECGAFVSSSNGEECGMWTVCGDQAGSVEFRYCPNCGREVEGDWGVVNLYGLYEAVFGVSPESPVNISQKEVDRLAKRIGGFFGGDLYEIKRSDGGEPK